MSSVEAQLGLTKGMSRKGRRQKTLKACVSFPKVKKAETLWWKVDPDNAWPRSARPRAQQGRVLLKIMQQIFPEHIALKRGDKWYAAGHRVRGDGLPKESGGEKQQ